MKNLIWTVLIVLSMSLTCTVFVNAQTSKVITFAWDDPDNDPADITHYTLYEAISGETFVEVIDILATSPKEVDNTIMLSTGRHRFVVTATNILGLESAPSNEIPVQTNNPHKLIFRVEKVE